MNRCKTHRFIEIEFRLREWILVTLANTNVAHSFV